MGLFKSEAHAGHIHIKTNAKERFNELKNFNHKNQQRTLKFRRARKMCTTDPSTIPVKQHRG